MTLKNSPRIQQIRLAVGSGGGDVVKRGVQDGDDAVLFGEWDYRNFSIFNLNLRYVWLSIARSLKQIKASFCSKKK